MGSPILAISCVMSLFRRDSTARLGHQGSYLFVRHHTTFSEHFLELHLMIPPGLSFSQALQAVRVGLYAALRVLSHVTIISTELPQNHT